MVAKRLSQKDVPSYSLDQAMRIPAAIAENYASEPTKPLHVAQALEMAPNSSHFRQLCGAAIAYGLTDGGYNSSEISLTERGLRAARPTEVGQSENAKREAFLTPRIIGEFMNKYNGSPFPPSDIAKNVLLSMDVPAGKTEAVFEMIVEGARSLGLVQEIKGKMYGDLDASALQNTPPKDQIDNDDGRHVPDISKNADSPPDLEGDHDEDKDNRVSSSVVDNRKVFITHGKDKSFIDPIKKLLSFGEMIPVVSTEKQSSSIPVPTKVMDDMRQCGAAIIHVGGTEKFLDSDAKERSIINQNVLIEIGAAMALYGKRFILLVQEGNQLPSNLQGLYEVRYCGDVLDGDATIRLLESINMMKAVPPQSFGG